MKAEPLSTVHTGSFNIQEAGLRDLFDVYRLEKACFPLDSWPLIDVFVALIFPRILRFKAISDGRLIGFVLGERDRRTGWIATIGVAPEFRRKGVAKQLLRAVEDRMDKASVRLCVRESNRAARLLYEQAGYREIDTWSGYYKGGEDAIVMEKPLSPVQPGSGFGL